MVAIKFFLSAMEAAKLFTSRSLNAPAIVCYRVSSRPGTDAQLQLRPLAWIVVHRRTGCRRYFDLAKGSPSLHSCGAISCPQRRPWC
jgi:hypothetical protein